MCALPFALLQTTESRLELRILTLNPLILPQPSLLRVGGWSPDFASHRLVDIGRANTISSQARGDVG